jgi:SpoIIAA-like
MITRLDDLPAGVLGFEADGEMTAADYETVLAPALNAVTDDGGSLRIVFVFAGEFAGMEAGAMWQDLKMGVKDWNAWERIALVTDQRWMRDGVKMFAWAVPGDVKLFDTTQRADAIAWAAAS